MIYLLASQAISSRLFSFYLNLILIIINSQENEVIQDPVLHIVFRSS